MHTIQIPHIPYRYILTTQIFISNATFLLSLSAGFRPNCHACVA